MDKNLFEIAARKKYRFNTSKGLLTTEDLYDLSLDSLDRIAVSVNNEIKESQTETFLSKTPKSNADAENKLEILKSIITLKQDQAAAKKEATERRAKLARLQELYDQKLNEAEKGKSADELAALIAELKSSETEA